MHLRSPREAEVLRSENVSLAEFDTDNQKRLNLHSKDVDKIFLLTPLVPDMVELSADLVEAVKKAGVKRILLQGDD